MGASQRSDAPRSPEGLDAPFPLVLPGRLLVRNGLFALAAQALPLVLGLACVPRILHGLGTERFGLLVLSWALTGTLSVLDLGLSSSTAKFAAEALGRSERRAIPSILRPAMLAQTILGVAGAGSVALVAPALVTRFLHVSPGLAAEATLAFQVAGLALPVLLLLNTVRAALEAAQRFDVAAAARSLASAATFLVPLAGVLAGRSLPTILAWLLAARALLLIVLLIVAGRILPIFGRPDQARGSALRPLFGFGGWVTVGSLAGIVLTFGDRFVIGRLMPATSVAYYAVALELVARLGLVAATLAAVLLPASSALGGAGDIPRVARLFGRSIKYVALTMVPAFALLAVFAPDVLVVWLGAETADRSAPVLRVLAVGAAFQVLTVIPTSVVQGLGRPDLVAKLYMLETPLYLVALWWLTHAAGIAGAAAAWSARLFLDGVVLMVTARRMWLWDRQDVDETRRVVAPIVTVCVLAAFVHALPVALAYRTIVTGGLMIVFGRWVWIKALRPDERRWVLDLATGWYRAVMPSAPVHR